MEIHFCVIYWLSNPIDLDMIASAYPHTHTTLFSLLLIPRVKEHRQTKHTEKPRAKQKRKENRRNGKNTGTKRSEKEKEKNKKHLLQFSISTVCLFSHTHTYTQPERRFNEWIACANHDNRPKRMMKRKSNGLYHFVIWIAERAAVHIFSLFHSSFGFPLRLSRLQSHNSAWNSRAF